MKPITYALPEFNFASREEIRRVQESLLPGQMKYCYENSIFYKKKFDEIGVRPEDIRTLDDLRRLPVLMIKADERQSQKESMEQYGHPFGMHLCAPVKDVFLTGTTSGTTGIPTFTYTFTKADLDLLAVPLGHRFAVCGVKPGDRMLFCFALGVYATSMTLWGIRHIGALPIDVDARAGTHMILQFAELASPSWLACTPSLAEHLAEKAPTIIGKDMFKLGLKGLFLTGETWATIPEVKQRIEEKYGCRAYDFWTPAGHASAISCDSNDYYGLHGIGPHLCTSFEDLIDPITKKPIDIVDGAIGEMVQTSLQRKACPFIKYAYGDIVQIFTKECPGCGFKGFRVKVVGRADDMLIVKGVNVYPAAIREVVNKFAPDVTGEMRIILDSPPPRVIPPLKLKIEYGKSISPEGLSLLEEKIKVTLHNMLKINPVIEFVPSGSFEKSTRKTSIFEKRY
jgi:phenylacetate-CoA ligase